MNHDHITRPLDVLNCWLEEYGYDKNRKESSSEATIMYSLVREKHADGEWRNRWILSGADNDPGSTFKQTFSEMCEMYKTAHKAELASNAPRLLGLLVLSYGQGRWGIGDPDKDTHGEWESLTDEQRQLVQENDPAFMARMKHGTVNVRIVNLITTAGLLAEVTMFYPDSEPQVEIVEQWSESESEEMPESKGAIDDALMSTFAFLQLIQEAVHRNVDFGMEGLLEVAMAHAREGDKSMLAFILRIVATGIDGGVFDLEDE